MLIVNIHSFRRSCRRHLHLALINYFCDIDRASGQRTIERDGDGVLIGSQGLLVRRRVFSSTTIAFVVGVWGSKLSGSKAIACCCCGPPFKLTTIDDAFRSRGGFLGMGVLSQAGELGSGNFSLGRGHC